MARYLLLLHRSAGAATELAPAELEQKARSMMEWVGRGIAAGVLRSGARICERMLRTVRDDLPPVAYFVIEADGFEAAAAIAAGCPLRELGAIDVFELDARAMLAERG